MNNDDRPHLRKHGSSNAPEGAPLVRDQLDDIPEGVRNDVLDRLRYGEEHYEEPLQVGWPDAGTALYQEMLDGLAYAIAGGHDDMVPVLISLCLTCRARVRRGGAE